MALSYIIVALAIQGAFVSANETSTEEYAHSGEEGCYNNDMDAKDETVKTFHAMPNDWIDFFLIPDSHVLPSSSVAMMAQINDSDKSDDEKIEEMKTIAQQITYALQKEMTNLLSFAMGSFDQEVAPETNRGKRSAESPMASTKMINRLLNHIKASNEYQSICIEKMMTAQEIADKYGVDYRPDTEILSELAIKANKQANDMNEMLKDAIEMKNVTHKEEQCHEDTDSYYVYPVQYPEMSYRDQVLPTQPAMNHHHHVDSYPSHSHYYPYETQIPLPVPNYYSPPVSKRPNFYETVSYAPQDFSPYCTVEPVSIIYPFEDYVEPEPELVGEELEETVSSKVSVMRGDEPGSATVNHVMTYTVGEASHFRTPQIERLPAHMQYSFFLI
ncbi:unnamed protein product [Chrysodeixis includens]|uniref:Uncharacterized protein n=1 Tax=Chrysodeixis includens TaxID=689277 RepID=A0A9P0FSQ4_CHRIL|nr:unnamed protein product [Chrysodeixis includens]